MNAGLQIAVDLEQGEIRLGSERVRLLPVAGDVFCLNDARGPLVRALKFEERSLLLADAADQDVASCVANAALVSSGVAPDAVRVAVSLALAGGGEDAPSFSECVGFVEKRHGWDPQRVGQTMALVIDRLCSDMGQQDLNGWKQIVFQTSESADLETLISRMVTNLSQRAVASASETESDAAPQKARRAQSSTRSVHSLAAHSLAAHSLAADGSVQSVSSVLPVKRAPFRVLGLNTDRKNNEVAASQTKPQQTAMSASTLVTPQTSDFPPIAKPQPNHVNFSLSQTSAPLNIETSSVIQPAQRSSHLNTLEPVATFPTTWQPFTTYSSSSLHSSELTRCTRQSSQASSEPARTTSSAFGTAAPDTSAATDWLAELAQLLEDECDLRGIDP